MFVLGQYVVAISPIPDGGCRGIYEDDCGGYEEDAPQEHEAQLESEPRIGVGHVELSRTLR